MSVATGFAIGGVGLALGTSIVGACMLVRNNREIEEGLKKQNRDLKEKLQDAGKVIKDFEERQSELKKARNGDGREEGRESLEQTIEYVEIMGENGKLRLKIEGLQKELQQMQKELQQMQKGSQQPETNKKPGDKTNKEPERPEECKGL